MKLSFGTYSPSQLRYEGVSDELIREYELAKDKLDVYTSHVSDRDFEKEERLEQAKFDAQNAIEKALKNNWKFDDLANRLTKYDDQGTEYYIDYENRTFTDINFKEERSYEYIEKMLNMAGY